MLSPPGLCSGRWFMVVILVRQIIVAHQENYTKTVVQCAMGSGCGGGARMIDASKTGVRECCNGFSALGGYLQ